MKISKATRWILTIGILAILLVSAAVFYSRQKAEQSRLNSSIAQAQQGLIKYTSQQAIPYADQKKDLEARISQTKATIATLQDEFESPAKSIELSIALFEAAADAAAADAGAIITRLSSTLPEKEELNGITYRVFTISVTAESEATAEGAVNPRGKLEPLLNLAHNLSERFTSTDITSAVIQVPPPREEAQEEQQEGEEQEQQAEEEEMPSITVILKIYAYEVR